VPQNATSALLYCMGWERPTCISEQARDSASETRFGVAVALAAQSVEGDARGFYGGLARLARRLETRVLAAISLRKSSPGNTFRRAGRASGR